MEAKFTPGQLRVERCTEIHAPSGCIGTIGGIVSFDEANANARRMVLAWNCHDDLLAALEDARETIDSFLIGKIPVEHRTTELSRILGVMSEAVKKAKQATP